MLPSLISELNLEARRSCADGKCNITVILPDMTIDDGEIDQIHFWLSNVVHIIILYTAFYIIILVNNVACEIRRKLRNRT